MEIRKATRMFAWSLAGAIVVLSVVPAQLRPETQLPHKFEHFVIFALTGTAFGLSYDPKRGLLALQLVIFAAIVEITQLFVPGRHARFSDFLIDAIAIAVGSIAPAIASQMRPSWTIWN